MTLNLVLPVALQQTHIHTHYKILYTLVTCIYLCLLLQGLLPALSGIASCINLLTTLDQLVVRLICVVTGVMVDLGLLGGEENMAWLVLDTTSNKSHCGAYLP